MKKDKTMLFVFGMVSAFTLLFIYQSPVLAYRVGLEDCEKEICKAEPYDYYASCLEYEDDIQESIVSCALNRADNFKYSMTASAHRNGIENDRGKSDCSGFVSGILCETLDKDINNSAQGYYALGSREKDELKSGSVIAKKNAGQYNGHHVAIYIGNMENGPDGEGHYIVDCSDVVGGSSFRKVSAKYLRDYTSVWNPWE